MGCRLVLNQLSPINMPINANSIILSWYSEHLIRSKSLHTQWEILGFNDKNLYKKNIKNVSHGK